MEKTLKDLTTELNDLKGKNTYLDEKKREAEAEISRLQMKIAKNKTLEEQMEYARAAYFKFKQTYDYEEAKTREKLEIKIVNISITRQEENKEATNDKISNYSKIDNEKNLNEILELISSNSKIIENKKVEENSKEIEPNLTHSYKNKNKNNKNKLPLIDKSQ